MTPKRWKQIQTLAEAALEIDTDARSDFFDQACDDDEALRREVEALLGSLGQVDSFMEAPALGALAPVRPAAESNEPTNVAGERGHAKSGPGQHIGPYRILHEIGQGGMGTVYAAARDDPFEHRVAIKLIRPGMDSGSVAQRFRSERQILANLDHPNIARLLDGGTARDGRPYFVMELIEGLPIDHYCDRERLPIRRRLDIFREVCAAVEYAHRNLVVHRDIKPSNILVTSDGMPKLLDFGIAKLLDDADFPYTVEATRTGVRPMTPPYASPEQLLGQTITTASDVYSLGILLYKLLTGRLPYELAEPSPREIQRVLAEGRLARPSTVVARPEGPDELSLEAVSRRRGTQPHQLRRLLAGDLDNIVLTALRQEPERRYGSVAQLAEDLRRHLEGLPVSARPDTFGYRAGKFLRRNKLAAGIAGSSAALVLGFAATMAMQARQLARQRDRANTERNKADRERDKADRERDKADRERDKADRERAKAEKVSTFLTDLFELADPESGAKNVTAREILDRGRDRIQELEDQPDTQAGLMSVLGRIYRKLRLEEQAKPLLEQNLTLKERLLGEAHPEVADALIELGWLCGNFGRYEEARGNFRRAQEIRSAALGSTHPGTVGTLVSLAASHLMSGDRVRAESLIVQSLAILEDTEDPPNLLLARALGVYTVCCMEGGDRDRAEHLQKRALELLEGTPNQLAIATAYGNLGYIYAMSQDFRRAGLASNKALALFERAIGKEHPHVTTCLVNIGLAHAAKGEFRRAESLYQRALELTRLTAGSGRPGPGIVSEQAILWRHRGEYARAESAFVQADKALEKTLPESNLYVAANLRHLAQLYRDTFRFEHAETHYRRAMSLQEQILGPDHLDLADSLNGLASMYTGQGRYDDAKRLYDRALGIAERAAERSRRNLRIEALLGAIHLGLGDWHHSRGQARQATRAWRRAVAAVETAANESGILEHLETHSRALLRLERIDEARPIVEHLLSVGWCAPDFLELCRQHGFTVTAATDSGRSSPTRD